MRPRLALFCAAGSASCARDDMTEIDPKERAIARPPWWEAVCFLLQIGIVAGWWLVSLEGLSLGWDTLNHHVYLGWMAVEGNRLSTDVFAAGSMSCQFPYAYAPLCWLQREGAAGVHAALLLALPAVSAAPAVWLMSWTFVPRMGWQNSLARGVFTWLGFLSPLWWSLLDSTSNDSLSALPIIWAFALAVWRSACELDTPPALLKDRSQWLWWMLIGAMAAVALMLKISQVFAVLGLAVLVIASSNGIRAVIRRVAGVTAGAAFVSLFLWWPWARTVWAQCGSPVYPMLTDVLRPWAGVLP